MVALALASAPAWAQEPPPAEPEPLINFVFASQLGSGVYASGDSVVQVYRIPISWNAIPVDDRSWGLRVRFPVTLGFYDFRSRDLLDLEIPDHVSTVTLSAVTEFLVPLGQHWLLSPVGELGYARDFSQDVGSGLYSVGIRASRSQQLGGFDTAFDTRTVWAGQADADRALADDFLRLESAYEVRRPIPGSLGSRRLDAGVFVANYIYFDSAGFFRFPDRAAAMAANTGVKSDANTVLWEIGITIGIEPRKWAGIPVPEVGVSYRFGSDMTAWRLVFGGAF
jgi:hypothetical protein